MMAGKLAVMVFIAVVSPVIICGMTVCIPVWSMVPRFVITDGRFSSTPLNASIGDEACVTASMSGWNAAPTGASSPGSADIPFDSCTSVPVTNGVSAVTTCEPTPTTDARRLPIAPSMVLVDVAARTATSSMPSFCTAAKNSSALISPFSIALRKSPSKAPALRMASWSAPDAPGMASVSWFQFSVMSFPEPAVCVMTMPTLLNVSALPPATALRLPAASAS